MPAHLVVIKGTEFFDGKTKRYVDFPITDVMQMMGRAGRPQFDDTAVAVVLCHDIKKAFYKKFMFEPFPGTYNHEHVSVGAATFSLSMTALIPLLLRY